ncbi:TrmH family RNA methyltransferase [Paenibacillus endophyticus]|uniref:TrmH family RNA methyltransferase n=1 Tax=Paenibacillus endophyticus TaxID=1294268 RepID=A0A7W5CBU7_9BACL|nr:RNA methyltransferase [Paenibacillus endophyticus]MBB3154833.1 TrmH family RNA methyltransferase [Paenibacillus endophyticus]
MNENFDPLLSSVQNDKVKQWASLLDKKNRDRSGQFLIEGVHLVLEALHGQAKVLTIVYDTERGIPAELAVERETNDSPATLGLEWVQASRQVMSKCTGTDTPPPVFAIVSKLSADQSALFRKSGLVVVLDGVRDPGNAGTIIRSADAVGADAVIFGKGCVDLYNLKTVRSTMGSIFHLPIIEADLKELIPQAKAKGMKLVGTSLQAKHTCYGYDWTQGTWLLMGSESEGLSPAVRELMDEAVIIPMTGQAESLNVAMAATVLLYESLRQRRFN